MGNRDGWRGHGGSGELVLRARPGDLPPSGETPSPPETSPRRDPQAHHSRSPKTLTRRRRLSRVSSLTAAKEGSLPVPTIEDVKAFLSLHGVPVFEFETPTPTAETAAKAVGCSVGEIAKTVLFAVGLAPVAVVTSGDRKVRGSRLKQAAGLSGKVRLPTPDEVERHTGYSPGGVCPFLLPEGMRVVVDESLRRFPVVYAAAGNDHSAVPIAVDRLLEITGATEVDACEVLSG